MGQIDTLWLGQIKTVGDETATSKLKQAWTTAMFKEQVKEPVLLTKTGLIGDDVGDKKHHGGPEKALFAYCADHYTTWTKTNPEADFYVGMNGENVSVRGMDETTVYIGDIYRLGDALIQVSQPRRPCWKPGRRAGWIDFGKAIQETGRTGWYFRVLEEGHIQEKDAFELIERPCPEWTIAKMNEVIYHPEQNQDLLQSLKDSAYTPPSWKPELDMLIKGEVVDATKRLYGPNL